MLSCDSEKIYIIIFHKAALKHCVMWKTIQIQVNMTVTVTQVCPMMLVNRTKRLVIVHCSGLRCFCILNDDVLINQTMRRMRTRVLFVCRRISRSRSGRSLSCGCTNHGSGMWSGSPDWTFSRTASVQSLSSWAWRPAPPPPFIPKLESDLILCSCIYLTLIKHSGPFWPGIDA